MDFQEKVGHSCAFCDFTSTNKSQLEIHMRNHTQERPFFCDQCTLRFFRKTTLQQHIQTVHEGIKKIVSHENKYKCFLCPYATHYKCTWEAHTRAHLGERGFPCQHPDCQYAATSSHSLRCHNVNKHKNQRPFVCEFEGCSYRSKTKVNLQKHKLNVHNGGFKPFACTLCDYCTTTRYCLSKHQISHMKEKPVKCHWNGCVFSCKTNKQLKLHVLNCHTVKIFNCDIQGCQSQSTFATLSRLARHKKKVHDKVYKCPNCKYRAAIPSLLQNHILFRHIPSKRIPCPTRGCTFRAKHRWSLSEHMRYHKANLGCPLKECGFVAHSNFSLKQHMQLHDPTGRPFLCSLCHKRFSTNVLLQRHLITHTQEKPFQCPLCSFGTVNKSNAMRHVGSFHPNISCKFNQDSTCDHCGVNFGCALGLAMHRTRLKTAVVVLTRIQLEMS